MTVNTSRSTIARPDLLPLSALTLGLSGCQLFFPMPVDAELDQTLAPVVTVAHVVREPFREGEVILANVMVEDVAVGEASLRAGKRCLVDGRPTLPVDGTGSLGGILAILTNSSATTRGFIDVETGLALESRWDFDYDEKRTIIDADYGPGTFRMIQERETLGKKPRRSLRRVELPTEQTPHDGHSLLGFLRSWDAADGTQGFAYVFAGRYFMRVDMTVTGRETVRSVLGDREAIRIDGVGSRLSEKTLQPTATMQPKPFTFWITDDDARIPLRLDVESDFGALTLELSKHSIEPVAEGPLEACDGRVDKEALDKARGPRKKGTAKPKGRRTMEPPFGRDQPQKKPKKDDPKRLVLPKKTLPTSVPSPPPSNRTDP